MNGLPSASDRGLELPPYVWISIGVVGTLLVIGGLRLLPGKPSADVPKAVAQTTPRSEESGSGVADLQEHQPPQSVEATSEGSPDDAGDGVEVLQAEEALTTAALDKPAPAKGPELILPENHLRWEYDAWDPATGLLVVGLTDALFIVDTMTGKPKQVIWFPRNLNTRGVTLSSSGTLACVNYEYDTCVYDLTTGKRVLVAFDAEDGDIEAAHLSPDESKLLVVHEHKPAVIYQAKRSSDAEGPKELGEQEKLVELPLSQIDYQSNVAWFPDGGRVLARAQPTSTAAIFDASTGKSLASLEGHTEHIQSVAVSPGGEKVATWSRDGSIILWDATSGDQLRILNAGFPAKGIRFSPDGKRLISWTHDDSPLIIWDVATGKRLRRMKSDESDPDSLVVTYRSGSASGVRVYGLMSDGEHVLANNDGALEYARVSDGKIVARAMYFRGLEEWLVAAGDGRFEASDGGRKLVRFRDGDELLTSSDPKVKELATDDLLPFLIENSSSARGR